MACSVQILQPTPPSPSPAKTSHSSLLGLSSCSSMAELKQYHCQIIRLGLSSDNDAMGRVIKFCAVSKSGDFGYALRVFDLMPHPDAFIYNTVVKGYLQCQLPTNCFLLYSQMLQESVTPNGFTFPSVIRACCVDHAVEEGKQVHAHVFKFGFGSDGFSQNNLIHMYVKFQRLEEARLVFDRMPHQNIVSWTTLISGYSQWGCVDEAFEVFESMPERNSVSWNAMIAAYVRGNCYREAFDLFDRMQSENLVLNKYVAASMLSACTGLGALKQGEWIHGYVNKSGIDLDSILSTAIIDMYCKCGCLEKALEVFNGLAEKGISSWNSMIGGLALHGKGMAAIELLKEMERQAAVAPDYITFVNVLTACDHSGLVEEGHHYFHYMTEVHRIKPGLEHFGCMVDLLGRAGLLEEAIELVNEMPMSPDASVLGALLGACRMHGKIELGEQIGETVIELEPHNSGRYVLLANIYANAGRWEDVANVRRLMNERGVKKAPGFSMIELEGVVNDFVAGGRDHPEAREIYAKVDDMLEHVRSAGYVPHMDGVLLDVDEEERENPLYYHSEKLAIGLGLLKTKPGETLRITKNLRICKDCHSVCKLVSKIFDREIIIRDRNRFHHFRGGVCSCKDYW